MIKFLSIFVLMFLLTTVGFSNAGFAEHNDKELKSKKHACTKIVKECKCDKKHKNKIHNQ